jgi:hypothetical protein
MSAARLRVPLSEAVGPRQTIYPPDRRLPATADHVVLVGPEFIMADPNQAIIPNHLLGRLSTRQSVVKRAGHRTHGRPIDVTAAAHTDLLYSVDILGCECLSE